VGYAAILTMRKHLSSTLQISVDYLSELPENEDCEATGTVSHIGKSTATATVQMRVKRTGRLAAQGTHVVMFSSTKFKSQVQNLMQCLTSAVSGAGPCVNLIVSCTDLLG